MQVSPGEDEATLLRCKNWTETCKDKSPPTISNDLMVTTEECKCSDAQSDDILVVEPRSFLEHISNTKSTAFPSVRIFKSDGVSTVDHKGLKYVKPEPSKFKRSAPANSLQRIFAKIMDDAQNLQFSIRYNDRLAVNDMKLYLSSLKKLYNIARSTKIMSNETCGLTVPVGTVYVDPML